MLVDLSLSQTENLLKLIARSSPYEIVGDIESFGVRDGIHRDEDGNVYNSTLQINLRLGSEAFKNAQTKAIITHYNRIQLPAATEPIEYDETVHGEATDDNLTDYVNKMRLFSNDEKYPFNVEMIDGEAFIMAHPLSPIYFGSATYPIKLTGTITPAPLKSHLKFALMSKHHADMDSDVTLYDGNGDDILAMNDHDLLSYLFTTEDGQNHLLRNPDGPDAVDDKALLVNYYLSDYRTMAVLERVNNKISFMIGNAVFKPKEIMIDVFYLTLAYLFNQYQIEARLLETFNIGKHQVQITLDGTILTIVILNPSGDTGEKDNLSYQLFKDTVLTGFMGYLARINNGHVVGYRLDELTDAESKTFYMLEEKDQVARLRLAGNSPFVKGEIIVRCLHYPRRDVRMGGFYNTIPEELKRVPESTEITEDVVVSQPTAPDATPSPVPSVPNTETEQAGG